MDAHGTRTTELIRVIGKDRDAEPPELVAFAERELARRLGGTRAQARRRLRWGGAFCAVLGAALLITGAIVVGSICGGQADLVAEDYVAGWASLGVLAAVGIFIIAMGAAVLAQAKWALKRARFIPLVHTADVAALAADPPAEDLLSTIGSERCARSAEEVADAELELAGRLSIAAEAMAKRVRRWGTAGIVIGGFILVHLCFMAATMAVTALRGHPLALEAPPLPEPAAAMLCAVMLSAYVGLASALVLSGVGLRRRKPWASKLLVGAVWLCLALSFAVAIALGAATVTVEGVAAELFIGLPFAGAFWVAVLRSVTKPFTLPEVKEACGVPLPSLNEGALRLTPAERRRRALLIAVISIAGTAVAAALVALGIAAGLLIRLAQAAGGR